MEFLPIQWRAQIGIDAESMAAVTLPSIPMVRHYGHGTALDVLLYTSPVYCQEIINSVRSLHPKPWNSISHLIIGTVIIPS